MLNTISRRLLMIIIWVLFSICSLSWWRKIAVLTPEDNPIWYPSESAAFLPGSWMFFAIVATALSVLYILELVDNKPEKIKQILCWVFIIGLGTIFVYPLGSKDIFNYVSFARLHSFYGLNPYLTSISDINNFLQDPFLKNMYHITVVSPYGPLWTWVSFGLYHIVAGFGLIAFVISFKALGLIIHLLITFLVYKVAELIAEGSGSRAAIIYGMNPLAIFEFVANAHNDGLAILMLLLALFFVLQKRAMKGFITLGIAVSFKFTAMLTAPFLILRAEKERGTLFAFLGAAIVAIITFGIYLFSSVNLFGVMHTSTIGFINFSFSSLFYALGGEMIVPYARIAGFILFFCWYYIILRKINKDNFDTLNITIGLGFLAYLLFGAYMVHRWYYLWPLALVSVTPNNPWAKAVVIQTIILLPCYTLTLAFGEINIDKSVTYVLVTLPALVTGLQQYRRNNSTVRTI